MHNLVPQLVTEKQLVSLFLAGLRSLQANHENESMGDGIGEILDEAGLSPLEASHLDDICEALNCGEIIVRSQR